MLTDSHCHLASRKLRDRATHYVTEAMAAGVSRIVAIGTDLEDCPEVVALAQAHPSVWATVGIHPCDVMEIDPQGDWFEQLQHLARQPKVVALGETGLDYFHPPPEGISWEIYKARQKEFFHRHLELAAAEGLNVVVHTRGGSVEDAAAMVREFSGKARAVFHCWVHSWADAESLVAAGHLISFTGVSTYKNAPEVASCAKEAPAGSFMLETDAPFLAPLPHRGKTNEPAFVRHTAEFIAQLRTEPLEALAAHTERTANEFFQFSE